MAKHISRPFRYLGREVGVEINFTREFYKPLQTKHNQTLANSILEIDDLLKSLAHEQELIRLAIQVGVNGNVMLKESGVSWLGAIPTHWKIERVGTAFRERSEKVNDIDFPPLSVTKNGIVPQLDTAAKSEDRGNRKRVAKGDYVINSRSDRRGSSGLSSYDGSVSLINIVLEPRRHFHGRFLHHLFRSHHFIEEFYKSGRGMVDDLWTTKYSVMKAIEFAFPPSTGEQEAIASFLDDKSEKLTSLVSALESKARMVKDLKILLLAEGSLGRVPCN